jgi:hypothetical protein
MSSQLSFELVSLLNSWFQLIQNFLFPLLVIVLVIVVNQVHLLVMALIIRVDRRKIIIVFLSDLHMEVHFVMIEFHLHVMYYGCELGLNAVQAAWQPKVSDFNWAVWINQDVCRLYIPMNYTSWVNKLKSLQQIKHNLVDVSLIQVYSWLYNFPEVALCKLQYNVNSAESFFIFRHDNIV